MPPRVDLELELSGTGRVRTARARWRREGEDAIGALVSAEVSFDRSSLDAAADDREYGIRLSGMVFGPAAIARAFEDAAAQALGGRLRFRLRFDESAADLLGLRWETLCRPGEDHAIATQESVLFSRVVPGAAEPVPALPDRGDLTLVALIAAPDNLTDSLDADGAALDPVNLAAERAAFDGPTSGSRVTWLCRGGDGPATLEGLVDTLRSGADLLYMVCHGMLEERDTGEPAPKIWLEQPSGLTDIVYINDEVEEGARIQGLATRIGNLPRKPRLAVLVSCQSASGITRDRGALAAFGPRLVAAGIPAVVAMQGDVTQQSAATFAAAFLSALLASPGGGEIDRAVAVARGAISNRPDWAMPVLFMQLQSGRIYRDAAAAPFMASELRGYVRRPLLEDQLIASLVDSSGAGKAGVVALHGPGGFGKTTVARAICHDPRVRAAFPDGLLWVSLGQQPQVAGLIVDLCLALAPGTRPAFASVDAAAHALRTLLAERRCLLVIDDVWNEAELAPFLEGGLRCARLVTLRQPVLLDRARIEAIRIEAGEMTADEAVRTLMLGLEPSPANPAPLIALAERLGRLPLALGLANGALRAHAARPGATLGWALSRVAAALDTAGAVAFDQTNPKARDQAVAASLEASLAQLTVEERRRLTELAVFAPGAGIPARAAGQLWGVTEMAAEDRLLALADRSLLRYGLAARVAAIHMVTREVLAGQLQPAEWQQAHLRLADGWGHPSAQADPFALRWLGHHLGEAALAGQDPALALRLARTVLDPGYQRRYLAVLGNPAGLLRELRRAVEVAGLLHGASWVGGQAAAARGFAAARREALSLAQIFALAEKGRVTEAEEQLDALDAEREWLLAAKLVVAWLAAAPPGAAASPEGLQTAARLFTNLKPQLPGYGAVAALAGAVEGALAGAQWTGGGLPDPHPVEILRIIGSQAGRSRDAGGPNEGMSEGQRALSEAPPSGASYEVQVRPEETDSFRLVGYAAHHPADAKQPLEDHLALLASNTYAHYRKRSLWPLLESVLRHPAADWARDWGVRIVSAALAPDRLVFQEGAAIVALGVLARTPDQGAAALGELNGYSAAVEQLAGLLRRGVLSTPARLGDTWGSYTRRLSALALAYRLVDDPARSDLLLSLACDLRFGFAGMQAPAWMHLAETLRICGAPEALVRDRLEAARMSAVNIQDASFCAQTVSRWHALDRDWWSGSPAGPLQVIVSGLLERRDPLRLAALHIVGETYPGRDEGMPGWAYSARSLPALAGLYGENLAGLQDLNAGLDPNGLLDEGAPVRITDAEYAPLVASFLSAEALVMLPPGAEAIAVIRSLVPLTLPDPTAADAVLSRLLFAGGRAGLASEIAADLGWSAAGVGAELRAALASDLPPGASSPFSP